MIGLMVKDLLCIRKTYRVYLIAALIYGALGVLGVWEPTFFTWFFTLMVIMLPLSFFALDAAARWDVYALALPVSRTKVVAARYLLALLLVVLAFAMSLALGGVMTLAGRMESWPEYLFSSALAALAGSAVNGIMLPLLYKFGPERARIAMIALFGGMTLLILAAGRLLGDGSSLSAPALTLSALLPVLAAGAAALLAVSFALSNAIYRKREL